MPLNPAFISLNCMELIHFQLVRCAANATPKVTTMLLFVQSVLITFNASRTSSIGMHKIDKCILEYTIMHAMIESSVVSSIQRENRVVKGRASR